MMSRRATSRQLEQIANGGDVSSIIGFSENPDPLSAKRFKSHDSMEAPRPAETTSPSARALSSSRQVL